MRLHDRYGQPVRKRWKHPSRRFSQQRLDGARPGMAWVDHRYFAEQYGWNGGPTPVVAILDTQDIDTMSVQDLKDFLDANGIDRTGVTLKSELLALAQTV